MKSLEDIVKAAWVTGQDLNLTGLGYGRIHWGNQTDISHTPQSYYYFLSGIVRMLGFSRILEIGTHCGGSTLAMFSGVGDRQAEIVTVDITSEGDPYLQPYSQIRKITGDANSMEVIHQVLEAFSFRSIDLIYIDADHNCLPTLLNYAIYATLLRPKYVVFDDITLNESMSELWVCVSRSVSSEDALDATTIVPEIRPQPTKPGFGLIRLRPNLAEL
jgi:hypothetical protein